MEEKPLPAAVRRETDPEWRKWFQQVERIKRSRVEERRGRKIISLAEDDERGIRKIIRSASEPLPLGKLIRRGERKSGQAFNLSREDASEEWRRAVEKEIFENSEVYSFKNGVLAVRVYNSPLLQEIRQFRHKEILASLRRNWRSPSPLVRVAYGPGGKEKWRGETVADDKEQT